MKTFNIIMLTICAFSAGMDLMSGKWIMFGIMTLCTIYWMVRLVKKSKQVKPEVTISDEAKEYFTNNNIKVVVNGKEVI